MKFDHSLAPYTKINSKWMKDLNVRQESIKIIEKNIGSNLLDIGHRNFTQDMSAKLKKTKVKMNYWDFINIKSFAQQRKYPTKLRDNPRNGRRYLHITFQIKS